MAAAGLTLGGNGEPKGQLVHLAQRVCQRPIAKDDIVYTSAKYGDVYQVTVTLNCMEGQQFVGETDVKPKEAEKKAAIQALIHFQPMADTLPAPKKAAKRKSAGGDDPAAKAAKMADGGMNPALTYKTTLNTLCMQLCRRPMSKTEIAYETNQTPAGFQSTVKLPCLPGEWGELAWAGEPAAKTKDAEQNAAKEAVESVQGQLEAIKAMLPPPPVKAQKPNPGGGKGKGKFKGKGWGGQKGAPMAMGGGMMNMYGGQFNQGFSGGLR